MLAEDRRLVLLGTDLEVNILQLCRPDRPIIAQWSGQQLHLTRRRRKPTKIVLARIS